MRSAVSQALETPCAVTQSVPTEPIWHFDILHGCSKAAHFCSRGALFSALQAIGLFPAPVDRAWAAFHSGAWQIAELLSAGEDYVREQQQWQAHQFQANAPLSAMVLKSPHHGSQTSSSEAFLEAVAPQVVVVSVGKDNRFGHPSPAILQRYGEHGLTVLRTDEQGTIELFTDGRRLWVETAR